MSNSPTVIPPKASPTRRILLAIAALALVAVILFPFIRRAWPSRIAPTGPDAAPFEGDSANLRSTQILPTLDTPIDPGKNAIWCAAFQQSWKKLQITVAGGAPLQLAGADAICARLNAAPDPTPDLPANSAFAAAGWVRSGIIPTIQQGLKAAFPNVPAPTFDGVTPDSYVAYACLQASACFTLPYFEDAHPLEFTAFDGSKTAVRAFGLRREDDYAYPQLRKQPQLLYKSEDTIDPPADNFAMIPAEFAIDLDRNSQPIQLIIARIDRAPTFSQTLEKLDQRIADWSPPVSSVLGRIDDLAPNDVLLIPKSAWRIVHHFPELQGRPFATSPLAPQRMDAVIQEINFRLDRGGMELEAQAKHHSRPVPSHYLANRPFLLCAKKRGADRPFFAMWIENAELLTRVSR